MRLVRNNSWSLTGMSTLTHPLQHISGKDCDRRLIRSWRHCQHWIQNNHQSSLCWWHRWLSRRGKTTGKITWVFRQSLHRLRHGDQCQEDHAHDKQHQWHQHRDQSKCTEARDSHKLQVPGLTYDWWGFQTWDTLQDTTAALTRLKPVWSDRSISLSSKIWLTHSLVTSIFLYAYESWILTAELQRRIQAMEMRGYCKILSISYKDHVTNEEVLAKIQQAIEPHEELLTIAKRRKLQWYGHVSRSSGLAETILQSTQKGGRRQER